MPIEVISLLSSPEVAAPPADREKAPARRPKYGGTVTERPVQGDQSVLKVSRKRSFTHPDAMYLTDDFDRIGDLGGRNKREGMGPATKKQRSSDSSQTRAANKPTPNSKAFTHHENPLQSIGTSRHNRVEMINVSSSPRRLAKTPMSTSLCIDDSPNPFASSPAPRGVENRPVANQPGKANVGREYLDSNPFSSSSPPKPAACLAKKSTAWDPISSSAPEESHRREDIARSSRVLQRSHSDIINIDDSDRSPVGTDDDSSDDEFPDISKIRIPKRDVLDLALTRNQAKNSTSKIQNQAKSSKAKSSAVGQHTRDREQEKAEKAAAKQAEKDRKQRERDEAKTKKAEEKAAAAALAEVNKIRTNKKVSTPEMIVDLPASLPPSAMVQAEVLLKDLDVQFNRWVSPLDNVVKWRRKVRSRFNDELGHWEPIPLRVEPEMYVMSILPAAKFVKLALGQGNEIPSTQGTGLLDLETHVAQMRRHFPKHTLIYLIEGLTPWMRKNKTVRNKQFSEKVRHGLAGESSAPSSSAQPVAAGEELALSSQQPRRRKTKAAQPQQYIDEDLVEDALLQLQVLHGALIHHVNVPVETAQWIAVFTQHISTAPYRKQQERTFGAGAAFCMENGQIKTGIGAHDTYIHMLQEITRVTAPIAYGVAGEFGSVSKLVCGMEDGGPLRLQEARKSANRDGAFADKAIGQALSRRLYKIFTSTDENSTDI